ncbi:MAG: hypothetical protein ASARMPRED_001265 [Alectoria sarmentosa]|nr:MAG: hypothetical protein ASARMPRED_001265 [Alectoria sarmentosa]
MASFYNLLHAKFFPPSNPAVSFAGKSVLVTGANCGLGFEAALKFVTLGAKTVVLACRSPEKGDAAVAEIEKRTGRKGVLHSWKLDMNSYASVQALAARVVAELPQIDIALLNAGVIQPRYRASSEGWEETLQVNVLSTALLAMLLLPILEENQSAAASGNDPAHLCFVSSGNYEFASVQKQAKEATNLIQEFSQPANFAGAEAQYSVSKLFSMYAANELAGRLVADKQGEGAPVVINSVNPGATATSLTRNIDSLALKVVAWVYLRLLGRTAEQGSRSLVSACALGQDSHGQYWENDRLPTRSAIVESVEGKQLQRRVWGEIIDALKSQSSTVQGFA